VGFNAMQPGRVKRTDLILFFVALAVIVAVVIWATV
jgi:hypothetical protein